MKAPPPDPKDGIEGLTRYVVALHECVDTNFQEARESRGVVASTLRKVNYTSLFALFTLLLVLGGLFASFNRGQQHVDDRLANMEAAGTERDVRLGKIEINIQALQDVAIANHNTLVGADRAARGRR